jgi:hypothetical protein
VDGSVSLTVILKVFLQGVNMDMKTWPEERKNTPAVCCACLTILPPEDQNCRAAVQYVRWYLSSPRLTRRAGMMP